MPGQSDRGGGQDTAGYVRYGYPDVESLVYTPRWRLSRSAVYRSTDPRYNEQRSALLRHARSHGLRQPIVRCDEGRGDERFELTRETALFKLMVEMRRRGLRT